MGKTLLSILVLVLLAAGVFYFSRKQTTAPTLSGSPSETITFSISVTPTASATARPSKLATPTPKPSSHIIKYLASGTVSPNTLTVKVGDNVTFINNDSRLHWPASDPHPIHTICPGFDALHGLATGESYTRTFTIAKTCPFHDHLNAGDSSLRGQIIVNP